MKLIIFFFLFFVYNLQAQIQIDSFDIADYARPNLERRTWSIAPLFEYQYNYSNNVDSDYESKSRRVMLKADMETTKFVNSEDFQIFSSTRSNLNGRFFISSETRNGIDEKGIGYAVSGFGNRSWTRKKFKKDQNFSQIRMNSNLSFGHSFSKDRIIGEGDNRNRLSAGISAGLLLGKGRIELVNDAWHALTILEFLEADNLLEKPLTDGDIQAFAERISEIKNFRNTDFRLELIAEYEALSEYLVENGIVDPSNYRFFAVLLDAWEFESFTSRWSGKEFKYGLLPQIGIQKPESPDLGDFNILEYALLGTIEYNNYHPFKSDWQFDRLYSLRAGPMIRRDITGIQNSVISNQKNLYASLRTQWQLQYLPSQRVNYTISLLLQYDYSYDFYIEKGGVRNPSDGRFTADFLGRYNYYVTPQLSWITEWRLNVRRQHFDSRFLSSSSLISMRLSYRFL